MKTKKRIFSLLLVMTTIMSLLACMGPMVHGDDKEAEPTVVMENLLSRGEFEKHYLLSDGTYIAMTYPGTVHYEDVDGEWQDIDNSLTYDAKTKTYSNNKNPSFDVTFGTSENSNLVVTLDDYSFSTTVKTPEGETVSVSDDAKIEVTNGKENSPVGKKADDIEAFSLPLINSSIKYKKAFGKSDIEYVVSQNKVKENIYINEKGTVGSIVTTYSALEYTAEILDNGSVVFYNKDGEEAWTVGAPYMYDSDDEDCYDIETALNIDDEKITITYTPDAEWMDSASYPVVFDPSVYTLNFSSNFVDTYVTQADNNNHSSESRLRVGVRNGCQQRTYFYVPSFCSIIQTYDITDAKVYFTIYDGTISGKTFALYMTYNNWDPSTIKYSNQPGCNRTPCSVVPFHSGYPLYEFQLPCSTIIANGAQDISFMLKYQNDDTDDSNSFYSCDSTIMKPVISVFYSGFRDQYISLKSVYSQKYLTVYKGNYTENKKVIQSDSSTISHIDYNHGNVTRRYTNAELMSQIFRLSYVSNSNYCAIYPYCSYSGTGTVLSSFDTTNNTVIKTMNPSSILDDNCLFIFTQQSDGTYVISPKDHLELALSVSSYDDGMTSNLDINNNGLVRLTNNVASNKQKWIIETHIGLYNEDETFGELNMLFPVYPRNKTVTSDYGYRQYQMNGETKKTFHKGIDISASKNEAIYCPDNATIVHYELNHDGDGEGKGNFVIIQFNDYYVYKTSENHYLVVSAESMYYNSTLPKLRMVFMHLSGNTSSLTRSNERIYPNSSSSNCSISISKGEQIACAGSTGTSTGTHLHIGVIIDQGINTGYTHTIDPMKIYKNAPIARDY